MTANSFRYILRETVQSLKRNPWLSTASVATVMITMIILGFSAFLLANVANWATTFESQVEIGAFVHEENEEINQATLDNLKREIEKLGHVASVTLIPKDEALSQLGQSDSLLEDLGGKNPLPDKFTIKVTDPDYVADVAVQVKSIQGIDKVSYGKEFIDNFLAVMHWVRWIGIAMIIGFAVASIALISINIKMNVFSRRREIQIMKLVGASNGFIRWPFLIEGMFLGLLGGVIASVIVWLGCRLVASYVENTLAFIPVANSTALYGQIFGGILFMGMMIGVIGSAFSLRKFLKI